MTTSTQDPSSQEQVIGSEALVRVLESHSVDVVFGMCGHTVVGVLAALSRSSIRFISVHHEQIGAHAADALARRTGRPGVLLLHVGPGLTNGLTGVANAMHDGVPMVVISGNVQSYFRGRNAHQDTSFTADGNQADAFAPFVKRVWRVDRVDALVPALEAAFRIAQAGRPGPVVVDVTMDVFSDLVAAPAAGPQVASPPAQPDLGQDALGRLEQALAAAERPVLLLGGGAATEQAGASASRLAEKWNMPVAYEQLGKGIVPDDHELNVGAVGFWGTSAANRACSEADLVLAVGARFGELDTSSWIPGVSFSFPPSRLAHVVQDINELGRSYQPDIAVVADPSRALALLADGRGPDQPRKVRLADELRGLRDEFSAGLADARVSDDCPMRPARVLVDVGRVVARTGAVLLGDTGWNKNGVVQQVPVSHASTFIAPGGFATVGFGPAAAIGAALDGSGAPVVALVGDGAFLSNVSVVLTCAEERIPVVWVVMNNSAFASIAGLERAGFGTDYGTTFDTSLVDFAQLAASLGGDGFTVRAAADLETMLEKAIDSGRPCVIDVPTRADSAPITGKWDVTELYAKGSRT
jgi:acetolactate synthase I/II/III large subunit